MKLHGREIKEDDRVWSIIDGWGEVERINGTAPYSIIVEFTASARDSFKTNGLANSTDMFPTLYWNEIDIPEPTNVPPPKAKRKLYLWAYEATPTLPACSKHFYETAREAAKALYVSDVTRLDNTMIEVD